MKFPNFLRIATLNELLAANNNTIFLIEPIDVININMVNILAKVLDFSYKYVSPSDEEFGRLLPDGNWTGMVGMLYKGEADLIVDAISVTEQRSKVIDYCLPHDIDRWTFATRYMKTSPNYASFFKPFSLEVWLAILFCFSIATLLNYALFKRNYSRKKFEGPKESSITFLHRKDKFGLTFLKSGSLIAEAFLRFFYTSVLLSILVIPSYSHVRTIPELAKAVQENRYQCLSYDPHYLPNYLSNVKDSNYLIISQSVGKYKGTTNDILSVMSDKRSSKNMAFVGMESHLSRWNEMYFVCEDTFLLDIIAIGIRKDFCCKKQLDYVLSYLFASGIFIKFAEFDYFHKLIRPLIIIEERNAVRPLSVKDFKGLLVLVALGYSLSTIILIFELIVYKYNAKEHQIT